MAGTIFLNKNQLTQNEVLIINFVPGLNGQNPYINPFSNVQIFKKNLGGEDKYLGTYDDWIVHKEDGTFYIRMLLSDVKHGIYYLKCYEKIWFSGEAKISPEFEVLPKEPSSEENIISAMENKTLAFFDGDSQQEITGDAMPGQHVVVAFNTGMVGAYTNRVSVKFENTELGENEFFYYCPNRNENENTKVEVDEGEILLQHFLIVRHQPFMDISGTLKARVYARLIDDGWEGILAEVNLNDTEAENPLTSNTGPVISERKLAIIYYGNTKTLEEIEAFTNDLKMHFKEATREYFSLKPVYTGLLPLPPDNSDNPESPGHPYQIWWDSIPHDLTGSNKQPLTPEDEYYNEKISYFWYYYGGVDPNSEINPYQRGVLLITKEVGELYQFGSNGEDAVLILTDAGYNGMGGGQKGSVSVLVPSFKANGGVYKDPNGVINLANPDEWEVSFGEEFYDRLISVSLHELGHRAWLPVFIPDVTVINTPGLSNEFRYYDYSWSRLHKYDLMNHYRDRMTLINMRYGDEWLDRVIKYTLAPKILEINPPYNGKDIDIDTTITVTFSQPMDKNSVENDFELSPEIPGTFTWENEDSKMIFIPQEKFNFYTEYQVLIKGSAVDKEGIKLVAPKYWKFKIRVLIFLGFILKFFFKIKDLLLFERE